MIIKQNYFNTYLEMIKLQQYHQMKQICTISYAPAADRPLN